MINQMTLDGVIQAAGMPGKDDGGGFAHGGWSANHRDERVGRFVAEAMDAPFDFVVGGKTYEIRAAY